MYQNLVLFTFRPYVLSLIFTSKFCFVFLNEGVQFRYCYILPIAQIAGAVITGAFLHYAGLPGWFTAFFAHIVLMISYSIWWTMCVCILKCLPKCCWLPCCPFWFLHYHFTAFRRQLCFFFAFLRLFYYRFAHLDLLDAIIRPGGWSMVCISSELCFPLHWFISIGCGNCLRDPVYLLLIASFFHWLFCLRVSAASSRRIWRVW